MGTRSVTKVLDFDGSVIINMYIQYDGYQSGVGADIKEALSGKGLVNGFSSKDEAAFNGMGCLAASLVKSIKGGIGGVYLYSPESVNDYIDFNYTVYPSTEERHNADIKIKVECGRSILYDGLIGDYEAIDVDMD